MRSFFVNRGGDEEPRVSEAIEQKGSTKRSGDGQCAALERSPESAKRMNQSPLPPIQIADRRTQLQKVK
jgi:hypothetical protein